MFNVVSPLVVRHLSEANAGGDAINKLCVCVCVCVRTRFWLKPNHNLHNKIRLKEDNALESWWW